MSKRFNIQWPYKLAPETAIRKALVLIAGVVLGAKLVTSYFKPLDSFYKELDDGKRDLLLRYRQRFEDQRLGEQAEIARSKIV